MPRARGAENQRADNSRPRGDHAISTSTEHVERRSHAHRADVDAQDSFQLFLNQASRYPLLTREEEVELAKRIERGDLAAKDRLINSNLRLVIKFARRYQGHGLAMGDLVQEAMLGLIRAAEKFDWRRGYKFSTHAETTEDLEDEVMEREQEAAVTASLRKLPEDERRIIQARFGTGGREARSL